MNDVKPRPLVEFQQICHFWIHCLRVAVVHLAGVKHPARSGLIIGTDSARLLGAPMVDPQGWTGFGFKRDVNAACATDLN